MRSGLTLMEPAVQRPVHRTTIAEEIRERLSDEIIFGRLLPGARLDEQTLADRYGVSRTPVREALKQLAVSGLAETRPRKGMVVAVLTPMQLVLMFEALAELEAACARYAAINMTENELRQLSEVHDLGAHAVSRRDADGYARANQEFHAIILRGCHNTYLSEPGFTLRTRSIPFRRAQFHNSDARLDQSFEEHRQVLEAIKRRDDEAAYQAMRGHLAAAHNATARLLKQRSE